MTTNRELWRDIPGWRGYYRISNRRRVRSVTRVIRRSNGSQFTVRGRVLKPRWAGIHARVSLARDGKAVDAYVSVLMRQVWPK
jgi:NUMOD4 motif